MKIIISGKEFKVTRIGNRFYYFSSLAGRKIPVSATKVIIE